MSQLRVILTIAILQSHSLVYQSWNNNLPNNFPRNINIIYQQIEIIGRGEEEINLQCIPIPSILEIWNIVKPSKSARGVEKETALPMDFT